MSIHILRTSQAVLEHHPLPTHSSQALDISGEKRSAGQTYGLLGESCPSVPVSSPQITPRGQATFIDRYPLIYQRLRGHYTTPICQWLSNRMPLVRHCRTLSWISHKEASKAATSSHIRINDLQAGRNIFANMHEAKNKWRRMRQAEDEKRQRWALRTTDKLQTPQRGGHSRSIAGRRCRLSAFVMAREAELKLIVSIHTKALNLVKKKTKKQPLLPRLQPKVVFLRVLFFFFLPSETFCQTDYDAAVCVD